ncbi:MAG: ribonuclease HI [Proteobacteria bacterium]|nr:ribonuclease HI [Pseudomonadota bacterium]MBU1420288.1 ribonuclease HI [Pseudomonadota bacterium]MBU1455617.1 ribonuclease HI [Pseudomonadota bacterium]
MAGKKFYAVAKGRRPGIYTSWPDAEAQVKGYGGARYKGFANRSEAEAWIENPELQQRRKMPEKMAGVQKKQLGSSADRVEIYTDGGAINNPGPGGYGAVILAEGRELELSGGYRLTTNNRMELMACIKAIGALPCHDKPVLLHSDSSYVVNGISKGWARGWRRHGWVKSDGKPALNSDLWAQLLDLIEGLNISFHWVRGHAGHPLNERCDQLAVQNARKDNLPEDTGYKP